MTESEAKELKNMTANQLFDILLNHPYPGATNLNRESGGFVCFDVDGFCIAYDTGMWGVHLGSTEYPITPNVPPFGELTVRDVHAEISRVVKIGKSLHANTRAVATETVSTEQTLVSIDRYRELEAELTKFTDQAYWLSLIGGLYGLPVSNPSKIRDEVCTTYNRVSSAETHVDSLRSQLKTMTASRDATQERVEALQQLLPLFGLGVNAPTDKAQVEINRLFSRITDLETQVNGLNDQAQKIQFVNGQMSDLLSERETLFEKIKGLTEDVERSKASDDYSLDLLHKVWDAIGWLEKVDNNPCAIEYIKRLKSKADRLSVVCRRLCGDENATSEIVHKALNRMDDESKALDFIGEKVGSVPFHLGEVQSLVAQAVKSLGEKTVEVSKLQEGIKNYKAQVEGLTKRLEQMTFERDTERVGNKWKAETIEDLKRTTVKLPNEHTLRRLFNRHNAPEKYDDGAPIPTTERFLLIIENLCRNTDCLERRFEELNAISTRVNTESEDAHATLDEMGVPRWTTVNNHNERYLSLSARIRQLFQTHTKV